MRMGLGIALLGASVLLGCSARSSCTSAAEPYMERFQTFKHRTAKLLELRRENQHRKLLAKALAAGDDSSLPDGLKPLFRNLQTENATVTEAEIKHAEGSFWSLFDLMFRQDPDVLQGEVVLLGRDDSVSAFRYPREREVPAGLRWHGLRQSRTFCALGSCLVETGAEPCVLIQLRPRDYGGSAGLTVGFKREP